MGRIFGVEGERIKFYEHILLNLQLRTDDNICPIWLVGLLVVLGLTAL